MKIQIPTCIYAFCFYTFCWIGLGTPFIWLKSLNEEKNDFFHTAQYSITLAIFIVFILTNILNLKYLVKYLKINIFLLCFLTYISISLLWSPINSIEKILLFLTILISSTAAFSALISLGWKNTWLVVMVSLAGYFLVTAICSQLEIYPTPPQLVSIYGIAFISGFFILMLFLVRPRIKLGVATVPILAILLSTAAAIFLAPSVFSIFKEIDGGHFRLSTGLFLNPNLLSRLLQILFIATLITVLDFSDRSSRTSKSIFIFALFILLLCSFALIEHRASTGRFVMVGVLGLFIAGCFLKIVNVKYPSWHEVMPVRLLASVLFVIVIAGWLWSFQHPDQLASRFSAILERGDFQSRYQIWNAALSLLDFKQFVFGVGLDGFWSGEMKLSNSDVFLRNKAHSHNGVIDLILQTGFLSVMMLFLAAVQSLVSLGKDRRANYLTKLTMFVAIGGLITMNIFESALLPVSSAAILPFTLLIFTLICGESKVHRQSTRKGYS